MSKPVLLLIATLFIWVSAYGGTIAIGTITFEDNDGVTSIELDNLTGTMDTPEFAVATSLTFEDASLLFKPASGAPIIELLSPIGAGFVPGNYDIPVSNMSYLEIEFHATIVPNTFELLDGEPYKCG